MCFEGHWTVDGDRRDGRWKPLFGLESISVHSVRRTLVESSQSYGSDDGNRRHGRSLGWPSRWRDRRSSKAPPGVRRILGRPYRGGFFAAYLLATPVFLIVDVVFDVPFRVAAAGVGPLA